MTAERGVVLKNILSRRGRIRLFIVIVLIMLALPASAAAAGNRRYVILGMNPSDIAIEVGAVGGAMIRDLKYHLGSVVKMPEAAARRIQEYFGDAVFIEEDREVWATNHLTPTQPSQTVPWGIDAVNAPEANVITRGAGVLVCVVDTGIQGSHPDLATNIIGGENFVIKRGRLNPYQWADDNGHGTHVAGTIAALDNTIGVVGVAPQAGLFAVKVLDKNGSGYLSDVAEGILSCIENGADVINMSLVSSSNSTLVQAAVQDADAAGLIQVAAAGNSSGAVQYPAKYPQVVAVSAVDINFDLASFSNFGSEIDFAGPGVGVRSTTKGSSYATFSGTSMAAPHVAGTAALMLSAGKTQLLATDIGLATYAQGAGLVDALKTVQ